MRRKVMWVGMAVMTALPVVSHAKGPGKQAREAHAYSDPWNGSGAAYVEAEGTGAMALFEYLKSAWAGASYRADSQEASGPGGWTVELMDPGGARSDFNSDPRLESEMRLGLRLRYTF